MGLTARGRQSRWRRAAGFGALLACLALLNPLSAAASGKPPAGQQYSLPSPSATGSNQASKPKDHVAAVPTSGSGGGSGGGGDTVPILAGGLGALAIAGAVILYRRHRNASRGLA
jgi:hypothetical protein